MVRGDGSEDMKILKIEPLKCPLCKCQIETVVRRTQSFIKVVREGDFYNCRCGMISKVKSRGMKKYLVRAKPRELALQGLTFIEASYASVIRNAIFRANERRCQ